MSLKSIVLDQIEEFSNLKVVAACTAIVIVVVGFIYAMNEMNFVTKRGPDTSPDEVVVEPPTEG